MNNNKPKYLVISFTRMVRLLIEHKVDIQDLDTALFYMGCAREHVFGTLVNVWVYWLLNLLCRDCARSYTIKKLVPIEIRLQDDLSSCKKIELWQKIKA